MKFGACVPGAIFLGIAVAAGILSSISLPILPALEVARTRFHGQFGSIGGVPAAKEARLGVWAGCFYDVNDHRKCTESGHGYTVGVIDEKANQHIISGGWTRGLAVTPVATGVAGIALIFALIPGGKWGIFASGTSFLAATLMFLAFVIDIVLLLRQKSVFNLPGAETHAGAGFWLTFVSFIFLIVSGCTVCIGHRRAKGEDIELGGIFKRFRR